MLVAVDVGNTNTVVGVDDGSDSWAQQWRLSTIRSTLGADWAPAIMALAARDGVDLRRATAVCIASVVPAATVGWSEFFREWTGVDPLIVSSELRLNVRLAMDVPSEVGADRIANAVAAWELLSGPAIVVDVGTATKVEAISADGTFLGGAISIGIGVSIEALAARASRLFAIDLSVPEQAIGTNTSDALRSGIVLGHRHMISGLIDDMRAVIGSGSPVLFTGGHANQVGPAFVPGARFVPDLTLDGIRTIYMLNKDRAVRA